MREQAKEAGLLGHAAAIYRKARVNTAGSAQLLVEMHDAAIACVLAPKAHADSGGALLRAHALVAELQATLQPEQNPLLASELSRFYDAILHRIVNAYVRDETAALEGVASALRELRTAWHTLSEQPARH